MRADHSDQVIRWAKFVRDNSIEVWQPTIDKFINAQFDMHYEFLDRLRKTTNGREKIIKLYGITNIEGYKKLLDC